MFEDAWQKRQESAGEDTKKLILKSKSMQREIEAAIDQILTEDHELLFRTFKKKLINLESEKALIDEQAAKMIQAGQNFDEVFELAIDFLRNPYKIWKNGDLASKRTVLRLVFAQSSSCRGRNSAGVFAISSRNISACARTSKSVIPRTR